MFSLKNIQKQFGIEEEDSRFFMVQFYGARIEFNINSNNDTEGELDLESQELIQMIDILRKAYHGIVLDQYYESLIANGEDTLVTVDLISSIVDEDTSRVLLQWFESIEETKKFYFGYNDGSSTDTIDVPDSMKATVFNSVLNIGKFRDEKECYYFTNTSIKRPIK